MHVRPSKRRKTSETSEEPVHDKKLLMDMTWDIVECLGFACRLACESAELKGSRYMCVTFDASRNYVEDVDGVILTKSKTLSTGPGNTSNWTIMQNYCIKLPQFLTRTQVYRKLVDRVVQCQFPEVQVGTPINLCVVKDSIGPGEGLTWGAVMATEVEYVSELLQCFAGCQDLVDVVRNYVKCTDSIQGVQEYYLALRDDVDTA